MTWLTKLAAVTLPCLLALPATAQDKKKDKKLLEVKDAEDALKPGPISGKITQASETSVYLRVEYEHLELTQPIEKINAKGNRQLLSLLEQQKKLARAREDVLRARNPREQHRAMVHLQRVSQDIQLNNIKKQLNAADGKNLPLKVVTDSKDFTIELDDSCQFRTSFLPFVYDEMGNPKKYTDKEKKELQGDGKLPGYKAIANDLKVGQKATITLARNKETENKLRGTVVLITEESKEPVKPVKPGKRDKK